MEADTDLFLSTPYIPTTTLRKILALTKRYRFIAGGTGASKTASIMQIFLDIAAISPMARLDVVGKTIPDVRDDAWQTTLSIINANQLNDSVSINFTPDLHITFSNGAVIHFISFDNLGKAHGARRDYLYLLEANYTPWAIANHLMVRTRQIIFADWNPSANFWAYEQIINNPAFEGAYDFITVTYRDNEGLSDIEREDLERRRSDNSWWRIYGEGQLGKREGLIYPDWSYVDQIPFGARLSIRGLDFGYVNDPTAIVDIYEYQGGFFLDERLYQTGMMNPDIAHFLGALDNPQTTIIADTEAKSIDEIRMYARDAGLPLNILPVQKGAGSRELQVNFVRTQHIAVTKRSIHLRAEQEQYLYLEDRMSGGFTNILPDGGDHALDATRYALSPRIARSTLKRKRQEKGTWSFEKTYYGGSTL